MSRRRKIGIAVASVVGAFVVASVVVAPRVFQVDRYRPYIISLIERQSGRRVEIGRLGLVVFPVVTITADDVAIANPPGFPAGNWLTVKRIDARPDVRALWHRQIIIRSLSLNQPVLSLLSDPHGRWNYEAPQAGGAADPPPAPNPAPPVPAAGPAPSFTLQEISNLSLKDGTMSVGSTTPEGKTRPPVAAADGVSCELRNINLAAFANPRLPGAAAAQATGTLSVAALDAANLRLTDLTSPVEATPQELRLSELKFDLYHGHGQANVVLNLAAPALPFSLEGQLSGVNAEEVLDEFPQARGQLTGTMDSRFSFSGQAASSADFWTGKQGRGNLTVRKGRLPKLQLNKSLLELAHLAELGPRSGDPSAFSVISLDWQLANGLMATREVRIEGNGIAVEGAGMLDLAGPGRLNYLGTAEIAAHENPLMNFLAGVAGAAFANGKLRLPFALGGTLDRPIFRLKTGNVLGQALKAPPANTKPAQQTLQNLIDLFKRKK